MSEPSEYLLKLPPFSVSVSVDLEAYDVSYSGMSGSPSAVGPSFVDCLPKALLATVSTHEQALQEVCYRIEGMLDIAVNYDDIGQHLIEGGLDSDDGAKVECPGCNGLGRYVGVLKIEDPCKRCGGSGVR